MSYDLDSVVVTSEPDVFYEAQAPARVHVWVPDRRINGELNGVVRLSKYLEEREYWRGAILPFNTLIPVHLEPGEVLVAKTKDEADLSFSAVPA